MGLISQETLEQIAAANDIVDVIGSYFPLKRAGTVFKALCPFHDERTPSFTVNPQRQIFKCFGCGAGGGVFKFIELRENVSFPDAVKRLAERAGIQIVEEEMSAEDNRRFKMRKRLLALHQQAAEWFHRNLMQSDAAKAARAYLKGRGIRGEIAQSWKIGYAPDAWDAFGNWAREQTFTRDEIVRSGLVKLREEGKTDGEFYDRFRDRVMFPICNDLSEVIAFSGRLLQSDAQAAKYVNSPETMLFTKGSVLFGMHKSKRAMADKGSAIVLEGQLDLITAFEAGVQNVVAPQGTAFTKNQAHALKRFVDEVVLCFDSDNAGAKATERSLATLLEANLLVRVATMPAGHDPDSLIREQGAEAFAERIVSARDFFDFQIDRQVSVPEFATPRGKMQFARKMAESVSLLTDKVLRETVAHNVAMRLEISLRDFWALLTNGAKPGPTSPTKVRTLVSQSTLGQLSLLALRDAAAREWILTQPWLETLAGIEQSNLLQEILSAKIRADDPASIGAFAVRLEAEDEATVNALLEEKLPEETIAAAEDCWRRLKRLKMERRLQALLARQRAPNLAAAETITLQKQILDLQKSLMDIARPFS